MARISIYTIIICHYLILMISMILVLEARGPPESSHDTSNKNTYLP